MNITCKLKGSGDENSFEIEIIGDFCIDCIDFIDNDYQNPNFEEFNESEPNAVALIDRGNAKCRNQDYTGAIADYTSALEIDPDNSIAYNNRGVAKDGIEDSSSIEDLNAAILRNDRDSIAYYNRGCLRYTFCPSLDDVFSESLDNRLWQEMYDDFTAAIEINPNHEKAIFSRGHLLYSCGEISDASIDFEHVIKLNPHCYGPYLWLANCGEIITSKATEAINALNNYIELEESANKGEIYFRQGILYFKLKEFENSSSSFTHAINLDYELNMSYFNRGKAKFYLEKFDDAISDFEKAIKYLDESIKGSLSKELLFSWCGEAKRKQNKFEDAVEEFTKAIEVCNKKFESKVLELESDEENDHLVAEFKYNRLERYTAKETALFYFQRGLVKFDLESYEEAKKDIIRAIESHPEEEDIFIVQSFPPADSFLNDEIILDYASVVSDYKKVIDAYPEWRVGKAKLINILLERTEDKLMHDDLTDANEDFEAVINLDPENAQIYYRIADIRYNNGIFETIKTIVDLLIISLDKATRANDQYILSEIKDFLRFIFTDTLNLRNLDDANKYLLDEDDEFLHDARLQNNYRAIIERTVEAIIIDLSRIIEIDPNWDMPYFMRGYYKSDVLQDYIGAIEDYNRVVMIYPEDKISYYNRGEAKYYLTNYNGAIRDFDHVLNLDVQDHESYYFRGKAKFKSGDYRGAKEDFIRATDLLHELKENGNLNWTHIQMSNEFKHLININHYRSIINKYNQALDLNQEEIESYYQRGKARYYTKDYEGAMKDFDSVLILKSQHTDAYYFRGKSKYMSYDFLGAQQDFIQATNILLITKKLYKYLNYTFEIYAHNGILIGRIDRPGSIGNWLSDPLNSPDRIVIIPVSFNKACKYINKDSLYKVRCKPLDNYNSNKKRKEFVLAEIQGVEDAKHLAKLLGCKYIYWSYWDNNRIMLIIPTEPCVNIFKDPERIIYYDLDSDNHPITDLLSI